MATTITDRIEAALDEALKADPDYRRQPFNRREFAGTLTRAVCAVLEGDPGDRQRASVGLPADGSAA